MFSQEGYLRQTESEVGFELELVGGLLSRNKARSTFYSLSTFQPLLHETPEFFLSLCFLQSLRFSIFWGAIGAISEAFKGHVEL
jgi:hypothetical protein